MVVARPSVNTQNRSAFFVVKLTADLVDAITNKGGFSTIDFEGFSRVVLSNDEIAAENGISSGCDHRLALQMD
jgi:hypothetical protein